MHGGKRSGAGRPKGSTTKRTRRIVKEHEAKGNMMPLDVMLAAMQRHVEADAWDEAAKIAKDAAPYTHARLAAVEHSGKDGGPIETETREYSDLHKAKAILALLARVKAEYGGFPQA